MGFQRFMNNRSLADFYYTKDLVKWTKTEKGFDSFIKMLHLPLKQQQYIDKMMRLEGKACVYQMSTLNGVLSKGPKVLRLSNIDFEILENTDVNISVDDYNQPYPTMVVDLPDAYIEKKLVVNPIRFEEFTNTKQPDFHKPEFVVVQYVKEVPLLLVTLQLDSAQCYNLLLANEGTIEEEIELNRQRTIKMSLEITPEEEETFVPVVRAALNACLYADEVGCRKLGPANPSLHKRQEHFVEVARKRGEPERLQRAMRDLKSHAIYFEFTQNVKLQVSNEKTEQVGATGHTVRPHWRKGHYRIQRHGPGLSLRKRIRIDAVLVNSDKFLGQEKDTLVTMED